MWVEFGGAKESWLALTTRPAPPKPDPAKAATAAPALAFALFEEVGKPLPEFKLRDVAGNTWTLDNEASVRS